MRAFSTGLVVAIALTAAGAIMMREFREPTTAQSLALRSVNLGTQ